MNYFKVNGETLYIDDSDVPKFKAALRQDDKVESVHPKYDGGGNRYLVPESELPEFHKTASTHGVEMFDHLVDAVPKEGPGLGLRALSTAADADNAVFGGWRKGVEAVDSGMKSAGDYAGEKIPYKAMEWMDSPAGKALESGALNAIATANQGPDVFAGGVYGGLREIDKLVKGGQSSMPEYRDIPGNPVREWAKGVEPLAAEAAAKAPQVGPIISEAGKGNYGEAAKNLGLAALQNAPTQGVNWALALAGHPAAGLNLFALQGAGDEYNKLGAAEERGLITPTQRSVSGVLSGVTEKYTESLALPSMLKAFKTMPVDQVAKTVNQAVTRSVANVASVAGTQGAQEAAASLTNDAIEKGVGLDVGTLGQSLERAGDAAAVGAAMGGGMAGVGAGRQFGQDMQGVEQERQRQLDEAMRLDAREMNGVVDRQDATVQDVREGMPVERAAPELTPRPREAQEELPPPEYQREYTGPNKNRTKSIRYAMTGEKRLTEPERAALENPVEGPSRSVEQIRDALEFGDRYAEQAGPGAPVREFHPSGVRAPQAGDKMEWRATATQKQPYRVEVMQTNEDGSARVFLPPHSRKGQVAGQYIDVPAADLSTPDSVAAGRARRERLATLDPDVRAKVEEDAKAFDRELWSSPDFVEHFEREGNGNPQNKQEAMGQKHSLRRARRAAGELLGVEEDMDDPVVRAHALTALRNLTRKTQETQGTLEEDGVDFDPETLGEPVRIPDELREQVAEKAPAVDMGPKALRKELRKKLNVLHAQLGDYDPTQAVHKVDGKWIFKSVQGVDTRRRYDTMDEAAMAAEDHHGIWKTSYANAEKLHTEMGEFSTPHSMARAKEFLAVLDPKTEHSRFGEQVAENPPEDGYAMEEPSPKELPEPRYFQKPDGDRRLPDLPGEVLEAVGKPRKPLVLKWNIVEKNKLGHPELLGKDQRERLSEALYGATLVIQPDPQAHPDYYMLVKRDASSKQSLVEMSLSKEQYEVVNWHSLYGRTLQQKIDRALRNGGIVKELAPGGLPQGSSITEGASAQGAAGRLSALRASSSDESIAAAPEKVKGESESYDYVEQPGEARRPATGTVAAPVRRSDMVRLVREKLLAVRTGRMRSGRKGIASVLGRYYPKVHETRLKWRNDIETLAHEFGHYLHERFLGRSKGGGLGEEKLADWRKELVPLAYDGAPQGSLAAEGLAEFVRRWATDAEHEGVKEKAPKFFEEFERLLGTDKELGDAVREYRRLYQEFRAQDPEALVAARIHHGEGKGLVRFFKNFDMSTFVRRTVTNLWDEIYPLRARLDAMEKARADLFGVGERIWNAAWALRGEAGRAELFLRHEVFGVDFKPVEGVKPLVKTLEPIEKAGDLKRFETYLVAKRDLELAGRGKSSTEYALESAAVVEKLDGEKPHFKQAADEVHKFNHTLLDYVRDSGMLSEEEAELVKSMNEQYVPFKTWFDPDTLLPDKGGGKRMGGNIANQGKGIKGIGEERYREIESPLESMVENTYFLLALADKNLVNKKLAELAEAEGAAEWVRKLPQQKFFSPANVQGKEALRFLEENGVDLRNKFSAQDLERLAGELMQVFHKTALYPKPDEHIVSVWDDGKRQYYQLDPELYQALSAVDRQSVGVVGALMRFMNIPVQWIRLGSTLTPSFMVKNFMRDQHQAWLYSDSYVPGVDFVRGLGHYFMKDEVYKDWAKGGGAHSMFVSPDLEALRSEFLKGGKGGAAYWARHPMMGMQKLGEFFEMGTRLGIAAKEQAKAKDEPEDLRDGNRGQLERAAIPSRDNTLDFSRVGRYGRVANQLIPFWNANVQDVNKFYRTMKENPKRTAIRALLTMTVPAVLQELLYHGDPDYDDIPEWQKNLFHIVRLPEFMAAPWRKLWGLPEGQHVYVRAFPKIFFVNALFGNVPRAALASMMDEAKSKDGDFLKKQGAALGGVVSQTFVPAMALPFLELWANRSMFFGTEIKPPDIDGREAQDQYTAFTSAAVRETTAILNKATGGAVDISPAALQHVIVGYTSSVGKFALDAADQVVERLDKGMAGAKPLRMPWDYPVLKNIAFDQSRTRGLELFYAAYDHAARMVESYNYNTKTGDGERVAQIEGERDFEKYVHVGEDGKARNKLAALGKEISALRREAHVVGADADGAWKGNASGQRREMNRLLYDLAKKARTMDAAAAESEPEGRKKKGHGLRMPGMKMPSLKMPGF